MSVSVSLANFKAKIYSYVNLCAHSGDHLDHHQLVKSLQQILSTRAFLSHSMATVISNWSLNAPCWRPDASLLK
jgi:hypothetical protein